MQIFYLFYYSSEKLCSEKQGFLLRTILLSDFFFVEQDNFFVLEKDTGL
jgi:hypothetical protein